MVRFTTTMYDPEITAAVMDNRLMYVFNELMVRHTHCEEVQELVCIGIMNLSSLSINLSKPFEEQKQAVKRKGFLNKVLSKSTQRELLMKVMVLCPVHRGVCTVDGTFCIVEAGSVERLLFCLENENEKVVDPALGALSTLLDDKVDIEKGVQVIFTN
jgi:Armadillo/beta-catenin-like repeat